MVPWLYLGCFDFYDDVKGVFSGSQTWDSGYESSRGNGLVHLSLAAGTIAPYECDSTECAAC